MALHNSWAFLWRQGKYKTLPLLLFYLVAVTLTLARLYYSLFVFYEFTDNFFAINQMMPVLKIELGLVQCWMMLELSLRIN